MRLAAAPMDARCRARRLGWPRAWPLMWPLACLAWAAAPAPVRALPGERLRPALLFTPERPSSPSVASGVVEVAAEGSFALSGPRLAVVAVRPGDVIRLVGAGQDSSLELGLGYGEGPLPDGIVWWPGAGGALRIPTWSSATFAVARSRTGALARGQFIELAEPFDGQAYLRFEQAARAWLAAGAAPGASPAAPDADAADLVAELRALRKLCELAGLSRADQHAVLVQHLLLGLSQLRPLRAPHMAPAPVSHDGGHPWAPAEANIETADGHVPPAGGAGSATFDEGGPGGATGGATRATTGAATAVELRAGETLRFHAQAGTIVELSVRVRRPGLSELVVVAGEREVARLRRRPRAAADGAAWTEASHVRALLLSGETGALRVLHGRALVTLSGYRVRPALGDVLFGGPGLPNLPARLRAPSTTAATALGAAALDPRASARAALAALFGFATADQSIAARLHRLARFLRVGSQLGVDDTRRLLAEPLRSLWQSGYDGPVPWFERPSAGSPSVESSSRKTSSGESPADAPVHTVVPLSLALLGGLSGRPVLGRDGLALLSAIEARDPLGPRARRALRELWFALSPHRLVAADEGAEERLRAVLPVDAEEGTDRCPVQVGGLPRWTYLSGDAELEVAAPGEALATHVRVDLRSAQTLAGLDSRVFVDGVEAVVHGSLGLDAQIALTPGRHRFELDGPPLLARIARPGAVPCAELRVLERWYRLRADQPAGLRFPLADLERERNVRLSVEVPPGPWAELSASNGQRLWLRGGRKTRVELSLGADADALVLHAGSDVNVRLAARKLRPPMPAPRAVEFAPDDAGGAGVVTSLERIVAIGRRLRAGTSAREAGALRLERAGLLRDLGQVSLAEQDLARVPPELSGQSALARSATSVSDALPALALVLPPHAADVVVLGRDARLPPLPAPEQADDLRALLRSGQSQAELQARLSGRPAPTTSDGALLADAIASERAGLLSRAADDYHRLYRAHGAASALLRAARLLTEVAAQAQDRALAMRALQWASEAELRGEPARGTLARLAAVTAWFRPIALTGSAGTLALVQDLDDQAGAESLYELSVRALLDAPAEAPLLSHERALQVAQPPGQALRLRGRCHLLSGPDEACQPVLIVAGVARPCPDAPAEPGLFACQVPPPRRAQAVELRLPAGAASLGWALATHLDGRPWPRRVQSTWHDIDAARPLALTVAGPTLVRVRARALLGASALQVVTTGADGQALAQAVLSLPAQPDAGAHFARALPEGDIPIGHMLEHQVIVTHEGPTRLSLSVDRGRALLALEVAAIVRAPSPSPVSPEPPAAVIASSTGAAASDGRAPFVARDGVPEAPAPGPDLNVGSELSAVTGQWLADDDLSDNTYVQTEMFGSGALLRDRLWLSGSSFARLRAGEDSAGVALGGTWAQAGVNGLVLSPRLRAVAQAAGAATAVGLRAGLGAYTTFPLAPELRLRPALDLDYRHVDARGLAAEHLDSEVYSRWADAHPTTATPALSLLHRIAIDAQVRYALSARLGPGLRVDRLDLGASADAIPFRRPWPWLTGALEFSHRPHNAYRARPFTRASLGLRARFFSWLTPTRAWRARAAQAEGGRRPPALLWTLSFELQQRVDVPTVGGSAYAVSGLLALRMEAFSGHGLAALPPLARLLRSFREEGLGLYQTRAGGRVFFEEGAP